MRPLTSLALLGLAVGCSPAAPPVETPKPPPPVATPKPAPAPHATWSFSGAGQANAQVDLGERGVLQVGDHGRRWLFAKGATEPQQAATIAPQDLVDARVDGAQTLLVGEQGAVFTAKDPLGAVDTPRPGPKDNKALAFRAGKQAILGVEKNGTLHRSTDAGLAWGASKLPLNAGDLVVGLAANKRGEALVLLYPQRVLLSTDDGATWAPIATPGIGARTVLRDGKDDLFLAGLAKDQYAKLASGKLELATPAPLVERKQSKESRAPRAEVAGNRVVTVIETPEPKPSKKSKLEVAIAALGKDAGTPSLLEASAPRTTHVYFAGYENSVVVAVHDERADPPTTKLSRTIDDGKTWEQLGTLQGRLSYSFQMFVGPNQVFVTEVCDDEANTCKAAQVKVGNTPWKEVALPKQTHVDRMQLDPAHDRAWILGTVGDSYKLLAGKLSDANFTATKLELPKQTAWGTAVDGKGQLRVVYGGPTRVLRITPELSMLPALFAPFDAQYIQLVGDRGFAYEGESAYETADGGEKWTKVALGASGPIGCLDAGCVQGNAVRLGWELPDPAKEQLASTSAPPADKPEHHHDKPAAATTESPLELACTPSGAWKAYDATMWGLHTALDGDVRLVLPSHGKDGSTGAVLVRGNGAPATISLLGPKAKAVDEWSTREWTQTTNEGLVHVRYKFGGKPEAGTKYAPVDVDLAWYAAGTGKVKKVKLTKVSPFRVGRTAPSALHAIVEGGLLFLPNSGDGKLSFFRDDGKVDTMARPPEPEVGDWSDAFKRGDQIVLSYQRSGHVTFALTKDAGNTWSTTTWSLGAPVTLGLLDGKMTLAMRQSAHESGPPASLFSFETLSSDPPQALRLDPKHLSLGSSLTACTPKTRLGLPVGLERARDRRNLVMTIDPAKGDKDGPMSLELTQLADRIDASGNACNDGVELEKKGGGAIMAMVAPHDLAHGWLLQATDTKLELRPLSCKAK